MRPRDIRHARTLRRHGIRNAFRLIRAARRAGVKIATAAALIELESWGRNVFGHDPTIFSGAGRVTRRSYADYKRQRGTPGRQMQGVGPAQLTWWTFQDRADRAGGCWHPFYNMLTGFQILRENRRREGSLQEAYRSYNGSGPAAEAYSRAAMEARERWERRL